MENIFTEDILTGDILPEIFLPVANGFALVAEGRTWHQPHPTASVATAVVGFELKLYAVVAVISVNIMSFTRRRFLCIRFYVFQSFHR